MISKIYLQDCMEAMRQMPDKAFELAICDPPYGSDDITRTGGTWSKKIDNQSKIKDWDFKPDKSYFDELFRVSKNQIIWGGNYFGLPANRHFLIWQKHIPENFSLSMCEYAWSSLNENAKFIKIASNNITDRFHPTQKPVALYDWILKNYAKPGDRILDTHAGSMSSVISSLKNGFEITAFEIDSDYFHAGKKRVENYIKQLNMFQEQPKIEFINPKI